MVSKTRMAFANSLRDLRKHKNMTQRDVDMACDLAFGVTAHYEGMSRTPTIENLVKLCDGLETTADWLLGRSLEWRCNAS